MVTERPNPERRELGVALRKARVVAGLNQERAVAQVGLSQATLSRIERGKRLPADDELARLLDLYQPGNRAEIEELARLARGGTLGLDSNFMEFRALERNAERVCKVTSERIPTALQCDRYILKQHELAGVEYDLDDLVRGHVGLANELRQPRGPKVDVVMSESSIRRMPGGDPTLVREQVTHLLDLLDTAPRLTVRLLMFDANIAYLDSDFMLLWNGGQVRAVYAHSGRNGFLVKDKLDIQDHVEHWNAIDRAALSVLETRVLLNQIKDGGPFTPPERFSKAK